MKNHVKNRLRKGVFYEPNICFNHPQIIFSSLGGGGIYCRDMSGILRPHTPTNFNKTTDSRSCDNYQPLSNDYSSASLSLFWLRTILTDFRFLQQGQDFSIFYFSLDFFPVIFLAHLKLWLLWKKYISRSGSLSYFYIYTYIGL